MFTSTNLYSIDDKGRLSIPSVYRDILRQTAQPEFLHLTPSGDHHQAIWAYPKLRFDDILKDWMDDPNEQESLRRFLSKAHRCVIDKQCRIIVPQALREQAGITRDVAIVGVGQRLEIWDRAAFLAYEGQSASPLIPLKFKR